MKTYTVESPLLVVVLVTSLYFAWQLVFQSKFCLIIYIYVCTHIQFSVVCVHKTSTIVLCKPNIFKYWKCINPKKNIFQEGFQCQPLLISIDRMLPNQWLWKNVMNGKLICIIENQLLIYLSELTITQHHEKILMGHSFVVVFILYVRIHSIIFICFAIWVWVYILVLVSTLIQ